MIDHKVTIEVRKVRQVDESPDLSWLGEYTDTWSEGAVDRTADDRFGRYARVSEYRYFVPAMTAEDTGNPDSPERDYERAEAYNRGDWCMLGVIVEAVVTIDGGFSRTFNASVWGIESDSDASYFDEVAGDLLAEIAGDVRAHVASYAEDVDDLLLAAAVAAAEWTEQY